MRSSALLVFTRGAGTTLLGGTPPAGGVELVTNQTQTQNGFQRARRPEVWRIVSVWPIIRSNSLEAQIERFAVRPTVPSPSVREICLSLGGASWHAPGFHWILLMARKMKVKLK